MLAQAAILNEPNGRFSIEPVEIAEPRDGEILVRISAVGLCHTDLIFASGAMGSPFPLVLGHEGAGVVERVGANVSKVRPGDKVLITFDSCGRCARCADHHPAYCTDFTLRNFACTRPDGSASLSREGQPVASRFFGQSSFASHAIALERNVVAVGADSDLAWLAPLGCGVQTGVGAVMRSLEAKAGSRLVIMGGGAVGLSAVMGGKLAGCAAIILVEPQPQRRALGLELGAHHVIDPSAGDTVGAIGRLLPGGADYILDTSGHPDALAVAMASLAPKGVLGLVGVPAALDQVLPLSLVAAITYGYTIKGIIEGDSDPDSFLPELVALHAAGKLPVERLIRHYAFADINQAIADAHSGACIKAVLLLD